MRENKEKYYSWKDARKHKRFTAKEVAKKLKIKESTVYAKESGRRTFTIKEADTMCKLFNISLDQIKKMY